MYPMKLTDYKVLTFDTYGTLIDWETGLYDALRPLLGKLKPAPKRERVLELFGEIEADLEAATPDMIYSDLLAAAWRRLAESWGVEIVADDAARFGASVRNWPAFTDSAAALAYLKRHYTLITLTNCDRESYKGSDARLGRPWDAIYTAQDIGSYKPDPRNFDYLLERVRADFDFVEDDILHVAQSLYHDHVPATACGLSTVWIDRRRNAKGHGATKAPQQPYRIDFEFASMADFVDAHRAALAQ